MRRIFAAVLLAASLRSGSSAAQPPAASPSPNLAGIAHVALRVRDLGASVDFYRKLGFVRAFELSRDGRVYEAFIKIDDRQFIELYPVDDKNPRVGFMHVCFEGKDLASVHDYYVAHGLTPTPVKTAGAGNLLFTMPGPATAGGPQNMEYTQYMPGSLHSKDFGRDLGPERIGTSLAAVGFAVSDPSAADRFYVEKAGFRSVAASVVGIPGAADDDRIVFKPAAALGDRARITLRVDRRAEALGTLRRRGIVPVQEKFAGEDDDSITDPDGNEIVLAQPPGRH